MAQSKRVKPCTYADLARRRRVVVGGGGATWAGPDAGDFLVGGVAAALGIEVGLAFAALTAFALALVTFGVAATGLVATGLVATGLVATGLVATSLVAPRDLGVATVAAFGAPGAFLANLGAVVFVTLERAPGSGSDIRESFGVFAALAGLTGKAFFGATLAFAEVGNVWRTFLTVVAACRFVFVSTTFAAFAGVPRGVDVRRVSGCLEAATARPGDAFAGDEASIRLDRLRVFTVAAGKSHNDTCATFALLFALCGVDGTSLFAFAFALAVRPMGCSALDCAVFFALRGRGTAATVALAALPVEFCLDGFALAVILGEGFVARAFGLSTFASAIGGGGAGIFGALRTRARVGCGANTPTSCVGGVTLALDVRLLRGFGVWPSGLVSTSAIVDAADFATGAR